MISNLTMRRLLTLLGLAAAWCALWQTISFANIAGGLVIATLITGMGVGTETRGSVRLAPLLKLAGIIFADLVSSTVNVATEVLTPTDYTDESIIAVHLPAHAKDHMLLLVLAITLTPGTAVVDTDPDESTIYLHLLHDSRRDETIAHAERLAELANEALPVPPIGVAR